MTQTIFIDTDVILDFYFDRMPYADHATEVFALIEKGEVNGLVSAVVVSNVYYLLRKNSTHKKVIEKLSQLLQLVDIVNIDKKVILSALSSSFSDFEDALQNYASEASKNVNAIVTRNIKDFKNSQLSILTPESYIKALRSK